MDLNNLIVETDTVKLRELNNKDIPDLVRIVRDCSEFSTLLLYGAYTKDRERIEKDIRENKLNHLFSLFRYMDEASLDKKIITPAGVLEIKNNLHTYCPDIGLFSPYGPLRPSYDDTVPVYIKKTEGERGKTPRTTFRLGIECKNRLIGCLVFDIIEKEDIPGYRTIGDPGVFVETRERIAWINAIPPMVYFVDRILGFGAKSENLYVGATAHPCNTESIRILGRHGFDEISRYPSEYGDGNRVHFVSPYARFVANFLHHPHRKTRMTINNKIVEDEI